MRAGFLFIIFLFACLNAHGTENEKRSIEFIEWSVYSSLPPLTGHEIQSGLAGAFSGVIENHLIVAGGANFPDALPWEGGTKTYWRDVYIQPLDGTNEWTILQGALPKSLGYGVSITLPEGILMIGGINAEGVYNDVLLMTLNRLDGTLHFEEWPSLPVSLANMTGARVDNHIYIAGGQEELESSSATDHFFRLDLRNRDAGWETLEPWPGPPRAYAVSAGQSDGFDNIFYLFSGRDYGPERPVEVLSDGYAYNPRLNTWKILDRPEGPQFPVMAGSAVTSGENHIIFVGGDDGSLMNRQIELQRRLESLRSDIVGEEVVSDTVETLNAQLLDHLNNHPGFSRDVLYYHTITNTLTKAGDIPFQIPVTTNIIEAQGFFLIPSGEIRPGVRTPIILSGEFISNVDQSLGWINSLVIASYFLVLVWMGWFFSKRQKNTDDYFRGGKRVPWWAVGMSIFGTALSAITFMAIPAKTYATDWSYLWLNVGIVAVAPVIISLCIPFYRSLDITSAYEYLEKRFNLFARLIGSASFILFQIGRMGVVLFLPAIALNVVTGIDVMLCIALMGVFSLAYTLLGGIEAVIWTDALQVVVLLGGAILALILISMDVDGGFSEIISIGMAENKFHLGDISVDFQNPVLLTVVISGIFSPLITYGTDQVMVQRYMTTETEKMAGKSVWTNALLTIPATLIFFFVGTALFAFFTENPLLLSLTVTGGDSIFPWFIFTQMPPGVVGLLIAGLFAAAMSTLSSSMSSAATAYTIDVHFRLGLPNTMNNLKLARIATLVFGTAGIAMGILMATMDIVSLWDEFQRILGLILGGIGGLFFLGMLTKKASGAGAIIGLIGSTLMQVWVYQNGIVHLLLFTATGFISCFLIGYFTSLLLPKNDRNITHLTIFRLWDSTDIRESKDL